MLGVPVLAGSCAYAVVEAAELDGSLEQRPNLAREFYAVIAVSMVLGLVVDFAGFDAISMLFWSAVINGVLAPPLIVLVVLLTSDSSVMGPHINSTPLRWLGWLCAVVMSVAAVAMIVV